VLFVLRLVPSLLLVTRVRSTALTLLLSVVVLLSALEDVWVEVPAVVADAPVELVSRVLIVPLEALSKRESKEESR